MAPLAACSKKAGVVFVAVALLAALLAAVASAAGRGDLPMALEGKCSRVGACSDSLCTGLCSVHDVGSCRIQGLFVYCCCRPLQSASADAQPRPLGQ
ncbi:unnamed protein product [Urochloa decumbens]|uniref:Uncharacterized protein n=1 Tax=Urochloa decumbens TaxID=240449 RepID=A0ABC9AXF4_9POAL